MKHDVFISFSFQDQKQAEEVVNTLSSRHGITCWICTRDIDGGMHYKNSINEAIGSTKVVVFIQSENSLASKEIPREIGIAFDDDKVIIPFRIDKTQPYGDLRYDLHGLQFIDGTKLPFEERIAELAKSILHILEMEETHPGAGNRICRLRPSPIACSEIFYGRDDILDAIDAAFEDRSVVFLRGMGGIGKSEIARQYARRYGKSYDTVVFARYEGDLVTLVADDGVFRVRGVSRKLQDDGSMQDDAEYAAVKMETIRSVCDERTLIILDNFDVVSDPFLAVFTGNIRHRVLITSRVEPERGKYHVIPVKELDDDTLRDMVIDFANPDTTMIDREDPAFPELFELTNRHTLSLELIAKYMDEKCIDDIGEMVALLKEQKLSVLSDSDSTDRYETIRSLFHITELNEMEKDFLRCLAMMPPSGVSQKRFRSWCGDSFRARPHLAGLGLIRLDNAAKTISLHPIVRQLVLDELKPDYTRCTGFLEAFTQGITGGNSWNWSLEEKRAVADCAREIMVCVSEVNAQSFNLYYAISILINFVWECKEALSVHQQLYDYACKSDGENSYRAGQAAFRAGWLCRKFLQFDEATLWLEERAYPALKHNAETAILEYPHCCTNLITLFVQKFEMDGNPANLEAAQRYAQEADAATRANHESACRNGDSALASNLHQRIAGVRMEQAELSIKKGEFLQAQKYLEEAHGILSAYENNTANMAYLSAKFASLYCATEDFERAVPSLTETIALFSQVFDAETDHTLSLHIMLAECHEKLGQASESKQAWAAAHEIALKILVPGHPTTKRILEHL